MRRPALLAMAASACLAALPPAMGAWAAISTSEAPVGSRDETLIADQAQQALNQSVTANFQDVDFAAGMDFLADSAGINIILSEQAREVGKPLTVHLVDIPLSRALEHLLKGQGLLFRYDQRAIWVATRAEMEAEPMETRVFFLNQGPGLFATFEPASDTRESVALEANKVKQMTTIRDVLDEVIPHVGSSSIALDERSGALVVTHVPYYLQEVSQLLQQLDVPADQVLIEARFLEVTVEDTGEWGLDTSLTGNAALTKTSAHGARGPALQLSSVGTALQRGTKVDFSSFANQANGLNLTLQGILTGTQYEAVLHALSLRERTKTLSAPRVMTLNNQTAMIKIVSEFVYATRYEASVERDDLNGDGDFTDVVDGTRETRFVNVPQDFVTKDLGIILNVTPSIGHDRQTITLALKPEVTERKGDDTFGGEVTLPRFTARDLETTVVVEDGQTAMLGGLMKDTTTKTVTRVPVLGSIPVFGKLFQKDNDSTERSNLLIFVTAHIVNPSGTRLASTDESTTTY